MSDIRDEMIRTLDRVVEDTLTVAEREAADGKGSCGALWSAYEAQGMTAIGETDSDFAYADALALVQRSAYHGAPVPLGETVVARRLLSRSGIALPEGAVTLAPLPAARGIAAAVPYARSVKHMLAAEGDTLNLYDIAGAVALPGHNQAGEPRDDVDLSRARKVSSASLAKAGRHLVTEGALLRSVELSGALERALEHSLTWVNDRVQFGKPIARFQAIQHALAVMASEVAAARAAVAMAVDAAGTEADWFSTAVAKSRAGEAGGKVANAAHAAFGAMGFTREHLLHYATRRLWAWRDEFGSEVVWQTELGRQVAAAGGNRLWSTLTANGR